jgi:hypothetical protein
VFCRPHLFHIALAASAVLLFGAVPALAAPEPTTAPPSACGKTSAEAIAAAEKALASGGKDAEAAALACTIAALKELEARQPIVTLENGQNAFAIPVGAPGFAGKPK